MSKKNRVALILNPSFRNPLFVSSALCLCLAAIHGAAADNSAQASPLLLAQAETATGLHEFSIPAQSLAGALTEFARQSGQQISFRPDTVKGLASPGLNGRYSVDQALTRLLGGTRLNYQHGAGNSIIVESAPKSGGDVMQLGPVRIEGAGGQQQSAFLSPPGYVAKRSAAGTKTDTPLIEVPQSISVITRAQMDARNVQREGEAFRYTAGVFAEPYGADPRPTFDAPYIRGFDASTTGVYRDGLREVRGVWAGFISEFYGLERVDILKGPSSVMYGQGGPGGIIDKISKRPQRDAVREIALQYGSFDRKQVQFDVGERIDSDGDFVYRLIGLYRDSDTQYEYDSSHSIPDDRTYVAPSLTWQPSDNTTLTLLGDYLHNDTAGPFTVTQTRAGAKPLALVILSGDPSFNESDTKQQTIGYRFEHRFNDTWTVRQNLRYGSIDFSYANMTLSGNLIGNRYYNRNASIIDEQIDSLTLDNQVQARFSHGAFEHTVLVGLDYQKSDYDTRTRGGLAPQLDIVNPVYGVHVNTPTLVTSNSHQDRHQLGVYAQEQLKYDDRLVFTLGLRQDDADAKTTNRLRSLTAVDRVVKQDDKEFTYRAGLTYLFDNGIAPYVSYSESFLPTMGVNPDGGVFKPTEGQQYEIGLKFQPNNFDGYFTVAWFDLTQKNVLTTDAIKGGSWREQTGEVNSRGIELEGVVSLTEGLDLIAAYTYDDVEVTSDNAASLTVPSKKGLRPAYVAEHMASLWADYTVQGGALTGFGFGAGVRYVGPTYADAFNTIRNDGYTLVDAVLHYDLGRLTPILSGARFQLNASNLFNKDYTMCTATSNCTWGMERSVIGSLSYRW